MIILPLEFSPAAQFKRKQVQITTGTDTDEGQERHLPGSCRLALIEANCIGMQVASSTLRIWLDVVDLLDAGSDDMTSAVVAGKRGDEEVFSRDRNPKTRATENSVHLAVHGRPYSVMSRSWLLCTKLAAVEWSRRSRPSLQSSSLAKVSRSSEAASGLSEATSLRTIGKMLLFVIKPQPSCLSTL